jgi:hypothetical protein
MGPAPQLALTASSRSIKEMDQVSANLSKQDPGHRVMPNRDKVTRRQPTLGIMAAVRRAD